MPQDFAQPDDSPPIAKSSITTSSIATPSIATPPITTPQPGNTTPTPEPKNDPRTIFGWCMYDWANSAYSTTVLAGVLPFYFLSVVVNRPEYRILGFTLTGERLWALTASAAALALFLMSPILGAIADYSAAKKRFLIAFAYGGALFTTLLYFSVAGDVWRTLLFFLLAQIGFVGANVFYDAFLPQIADEDTMDRVSGRGYAFGYVGGGLQFAIALGLIAMRDLLGISESTAARIGIAMAGLWWAGFTLFTVAYVRESGAVAPDAPNAARRTSLLEYLVIGVRRTLGTIKRVRKFRHLLLFLIAFMLYNDGIQTVIIMATAYGTDELKLSATPLMLTLLIIQAVAVVGAILFSRIASWIGTKPAIMLSLVIWSGLTLYAYFITSQTQYMILGAIVGLVLGGSQALSRSYYGAMIPEEASAEFYGFYTVFSKFSAIWGPLQFAVVDMLFESSRLAIMSLVVFFVGGMILLAFVNDDKARAARQEGAF